MKLIAVASCLVALTWTAPTVDPEAAAKQALPALIHEEIHDDRGQYSLHYLTALGTEVTESGRLIHTADGKSYVLAIEGEVKYVGDDGKIYITRYRAGPEGSQIEGAHIPEQAVPESALVSEEPVAEIVPAPKEPVAAVVPVPATVQVEPVVVPASVPERPVVVPAPVPEEAVAVPIPANFAPFSFVVRN